MQPLRLAVKPGAWRMYMARKADPAFSAFAEKVLQRDNFKCQFCGFQARDYQEIINLDNDYRNNKLSNLVTACCFCSQCYFIEMVGTGEFGGGTLIYLPEIKQADLDSFCHVLFCAITNETGYKAIAQSIYRSLKFRAQSVEEQFGEGLSNPANFGRLLIETGADDEAQKGLFANIRLLPSRARFKMQIEHWASTAMQELSS